MKESKKKEKEKPVRGRAAKTCPTPTHPLVLHACVLFPAAPPGASAARAAPAAEAVPRPGLRGLLLSPAHIRTHIRTHIRGCIAITCTYKDTYKVTYKVTYKGVYCYHLPERHPFK